MRSAWLFLVVACVVACEHDDACTDEEAKQYGDRCGQKHIFSTFGDQDQFGHEIAGRVHAGFQLVNDATVRVDASEPRMGSDKSWVSGDGAIDITNDFGLFRFTYAPSRYDLTIRKGLDVLVMRDLALRAVDPPFGDDGPPRAFTSHVNVTVDPPLADGSEAAFFVSGEDALAVSGSIEKGADVMVGVFTKPIRLHVVAFDPRATLAKPSGYGYVDIRVDPAITTEARVVLAPVTQQAQFGINPVLGPGVVETDSELTIDFGVRTSLRRITIVNPGKQAAILVVPNARYIVRSRGTRADGSSDSGTFVVDPTQTPTPLLYAPPTLISPANLSFVDGPLVAEGRGTHEHVLVPLADPKAPRIRIVTTSREATVPDLSRLGFQQPHGPYSWTVRRWPDVSHADVLSGPDARVALPTALSETRSISFR